MKGDEGIHTLIIGWFVRVHSLRMLLHLLPFVLVESGNWVGMAKKDNQRHLFMEFSAGGVPWSRCVDASLPLDD